MAAILDFQVAGLADLFSGPLRLIMQNLVLVSQFARFFPYLPHYYLDIGLTGLRHLLKQMAGTDQFTSTKFRDWGHGTERDVVGYIIRYTLVF